MGYLLYVIVDNCLQLMKLDLDNMGLFMSTTKKRLSNPPPINHRSPI